MATVTAIKDPKNRQKALSQAAKAGARTLAGGLALPEGKHKFVVAGEGAFGILNVQSKASGDWALPIVAGTCTVTGTKEKIVFELSEKSGAKTLVIPDNFFLAMSPNGTYMITIESRNGRKVVTAVEADGEVTAGDADADNDSDEL